MVPRNKFSRFYVCLYCQKSVLSQSACFLFACLSVTPVSQDVCVFLVCVFFLVGKINPCVVALDAPFITGDHSK